MQRLTWTDQRDVRGGVGSTHALFDDTTLVVVSREALGFVDDTELVQVALPEPARSWTSTPRGLVGVSETGTVFRVRDRELTTLGTIGPRQYPALAWDRQRERVIIIGGLAGRTMSAQSWELVGDTLQKSPIKNGPKEWMGGCAWSPSRGGLVFALGTSSVATAARKATYELVDGVWRSFPTKWPLSLGPDICATDPVSATVIAVPWGRLTGVEPTVWRHEGGGTWTHRATLSVPLHGLEGQDAVSMAIAFDPHHRRIVFVRHLEGSGTTRVGHADLADVLG